MRGGNSEKTAKEIAKYLKYVCGCRCQVADRGRLTDHDMLIGCFEKLKRVKVGGFPRWTPCVRPCAL